MPVVVTGADNPLGRAVVTALRDRGVEVRATTRSLASARELRSLGIPTAVSDLVDPTRLGAVLEGAHTVIHLDRAEPETAARHWGYLLDAAQDSGVRRLVTVGEPGSTPPPAPGYDVALVRASSWEPVPALVAALLGADTRREVAPVEVVDVPGG